MTPEEKEAYKLQKKELMDLKLQELNKPQTEDATVEEEKTNPYVENEEDESELSSSQIESKKKFKFGSKLKQM